MPAEGAARQRLFIALPCPLSPSIAAAVDALCEAQRDPAAGLRVVATDTLHITLGFLGSVPADRIPDIHAAMAQLRDMPAPRLVIASAGWFSNALWLGVRESGADATGVTPLAALAQRCEAALVACGFALDRRPFHPHVTLARLRSDARFDCTAWCTDRRDSVWTAFTASTVHLYRSETLQGGARYSVIHSTALG
ncbi:MAG: RNA 2',3'-cyclic phosphodiesterase [Gammaproteobacteria bacterium]